MTWPRYLRYLIAHAIGILLCLPVWSAEISLEQAKTAVSNWTRQAPHPLGARLGKTVRSARTFSDSDGNSLFHVVRFREGGFAVAAADDGILPIIAFSDGDDLVVDERNPLWVMLNRDLPQRLAMAKKAARRQLPAQPPMWQPQPVRRAVPAGLPVARAPAERFRPASVPLNFHR